MFCNIGVRLENLFEASNATIIDGYLPVNTSAVVLSWDGDAKVGGLAPLPRQPLVYIVGFTLICVLASSSSAERVIDNWDVCRTVVM